MTSKLYPIYQLCFEKVKTQIITESKSKIYGDINLFEPGLIQNSGICINEIDYILKEIYDDKKSATDCGKKFITGDVARYIKQKSDDDTSSGFKIINSDNKIFWTIK
jgi:hypothetical protein